MTVPAPPPAYPLLADIRTWTGVTAASLADEVLQGIADGEQSAQMRMCRVAGDTLDPALRAAFMRRCARAIAARGVPLGMVGDAEYGPARLPSFDAEIERLEGPWRKVVMG